MLEERLGEIVPKRYRAGTHRSAAPAETVARAMRLAPVLGITRVANVTGLDTVGIPVVMVARPNARSLSVSQGKGLDVEAARASGLMESVESYHAERPLLPLLLASYEELRYTRRVADVAGLPRSARARFDPMRPILWAEGLELMRRERVWVPFDLVHCNYTREGRGHPSGFLCSSNGLASGNHPLEAVCHALYEVIERDARALLGLRAEEAQRDAQLDLASVGDPACREALARFERAGVAVAAWDMTSDVGVPAFRCRAVDREAHPLRPLFGSEGMGCHPSPAVALLRALTEAAQSRLTLISGSRDDIFRADYARVSDPASIERVRAQALRCGARPFAGGAGWEADTFGEDLARTLALLAAAGVREVVAVDLGRPELGIPVVKVIVPGLEIPAAGGRGRPGPRARAAGGAA